jgi:hypothetical protein
VCDCYACSEMVNCFFRVFVKTDSFHPVVGEGELLIFFPITSTGSVAVADLLCAIRYTKQVGLHLPLT